MRKILEYFVVTIIGVVLVAAILVFIILPRLDWSATGKPGYAEKWVTGYALRHWIQAKASDQSNPMPPTPENLQIGQREFDEHCAVCHGFDGGGRNELHADFNPPVARLASGLKRVPDGKLYFIIANGIRLTGMPGFGPYHNPDTLWRIILWVRHFPQLTDQEKAAIQEKMKD
jgi:mono/diheme cytochrome c family protein